MSPIAALPLEVFEPICFLLPFHSQIALGKTCRGLWQKVSAANFKPLQQMAQSLGIFLGDKPPLQSLKNHYIDFVQLFLLVTADQGGLELSSSKSLLQQYENIIDHLEKNENCRHRFVVNAAAKGYRAFVRLMLPMKLSLATRGKAIEQIAATTFSHENNAKQTLAIVSDLLADGPIPAHSWERSLPHVARTQNTPLAQLLLEKASDIRTKYLMNAMKQAAEKGSAAIFKMIFETAQHRKRKLNQSVLRDIACLAAGGGHTEIVQTLLSKLPASLQVLPFSSAACYCQLNTLEIFLEQGQIPIQDIDEEMREAERLGHASVAELLRLKKTSRIAPPPS